MFLLSHLMPRLNENKSNMGHGGLSGMKTASLTVHIRFIFFLYII